LVYEATGNTDSALSNQDRTIALFPTFGTARLARARILTKRGRFGGALADYNIVLQNNPSSVEALIGRASVYRTIGKPENAWSDLNAVLTEDLDYEYQDSVFTTLTYMKETGQIKQSSLSIPHYPYNAFKWSRPMWEIGLGIRTSYDQGMVFSPPSAILVGQTNFRLSMPLSLGFVFWNRFRLGGEIPLEIDIIPIEIAGYMYTTHVVLMTGGVQSASFGIDFQVLDGLWDKPYLITNLHLISPAIKKLFEGYLSSEEGFGHTSLDFGETIWYGLAGLEWDIPTLSVARLIGSISFLDPLYARRKSILGVGFGIKSHLLEGETSANLGFIIERSWFKPYSELESYVKHTRYRMFLEKIERNSLWTWSFGVGQENWPKGHEDKQYLFGSMNVGKYIWLKRGWF